MSGRVMRRGYHAIKRLAPCDDSGAVVAQRAIILNELGVATPKMIFNAATHEQSTQWIDGDSARVCIPDIAEAVQDDDDHFVMTLFKRLFDPLAALHRINTSALNCEAYRCDRMIRPRLRRMLSADRTVEAEILERRINALAQKAERILSGACSGFIHGDFHVGQLILPDAEGSTTWLLDLDDMATGPPEVDLANFCAHLSTTTPFRQDDAPTTCKVLSRIASDAYCDLTSYRARPASMDVFGSLALLRRRLKSWECTLGLAVA